MSSRDPKVTGGWFSGITDHQARIPTTATAPGSELSRRDVMARLLQAWAPDGYGVCGFLGMTNCSERCSVTFDTALRTGPWLRVCWTGRRNNNKTRINGTEKFPQRLLLLLPFKLPLHGSNTVVHSASACCCDVCCIHWAVMWTFYQIGVPLARGSVGDFVISALLHFTSWHADCSDLIREYPSKQGLWLGCFIYLHCCRQFFLWFQDF